MDKERPDSAQEPVPNEDPKLGDTNEVADDKVDVVEPDGAPAPEA